MRMLSMAPWLPWSMMSMASIPDALPVKGTTNGPLVLLLVTSVTESGGLEIPKEIARYYRGAQFSYGCEASKALAS